MNDKHRTLRAMAEAAGWSALDLAEAILEVSGDDLSMITVIDLETPEPEPQPEPTETPEEERARAILDWYRQCLEQWPIFGQTMH